MIHSAPMTRSSHLTVLLATALAAGAAGFLLGRSTAAPHLPAPPPPDAARAGPPARPAAETPPAVSPAPPRPAPLPPATPPAGGFPFPPAAPPATPLPEEPEARARLAGEIAARAEAAFDKGTGAEVLEALKELAAIVPEGRAAAMELALRVNSDVEGENRLGLNRVNFYMSLGAPAMRDLMNWALENPSPADFRVMTAYSLVWTQPADETIRKYSAALAAEQDENVQRALVGNLAFLKEPAAMQALSDIFLDASRDARLRALVAPELAASADPAVAAALENAARGDSDERVRSAAAVALVVRDPPASGYLVTGTLPDSQAAEAGVKSGDILVSYGGRPTRTLEALREAAAGAAGQEKVPVVVMREGREVTLYLRPGRMGVFGREVRAAADR